MIKFSVVIPLYNKEKEIKDTIESVLNQSYFADEIIVVNDGSTDKSAEVVKKNFGNKVKIINQKNLGVSAARNKGIREAKNEYICLLDADDLWERDFLKEIKILIEKFPEAVAFSTAHKIMDEEGKIFINKIPFKENFLGIINNFIKVFKDNYGIIHSSSVCIKKSLNLYFPEGEKKGEDICFWIELSIKGNLAFSSKPLSIYRLNTTNRSNVIHEKTIIPCQLKWIYKNKNRATKDIIKFVHKNILITVYGNVADGNYKFAKDVINFMKKNNDWFWIFLLPSLFLGERFLNKIKKIRRKSYNFHYKIN